MVNKQITTLHTTSQRRRFAKKILQKVISFQNKYVLHSLFCSDVDVAKRLKFREFFFWWENSFAKMKPLKFGSDLYLVAVM